MPSNSLLRRLFQATCAAAILAAAPIATAAPESVVKNLRSWAPLSVTLSNGTLEVVTPQDRVTDDIYLAVVRSGVCGSLWLHPGSWSGVSEIKVLNRHAHQGYVFEGGEVECMELGELNGKQSELYVLGRTRFN